MNSPKSRHQRVFLGMSGGVDSSVSAILLKEQGYDVTGVYMKNWSKDLPGMKCPWAEDLADAKRVAVQLDLDFEIWDFEADYKREVVDYMLAEFQQGRTPNPDIICNELIKFKLFYDRAMARGTDFIATGHYARTEPLESTKQEGLNTTRLLRAIDENKDQTYFLYRMSDVATAHTLFPIGHLTKPEVKRLAADHHLDVATKKESMGVCFVGDVGMKDFLREYLDALPGEIREQETDRVLGYHDGAIFYTIGQRHGLYLGGGLPYYVVRKDLPHNIVYVSKNLNHSDLWATSIKLEHLHLRNRLTVDSLEHMDNLKVRLRHRAPLISVKFSQLRPNEHDRRQKGYSHISIESSQPQPSSSSQSPQQNRPNSHLYRDSGESSGDSISQQNQLDSRPHQDLCGLLTFSEPIKKPAAGQSAVFYSGEICLGGGIISE